MLLSRESLGEGQATEAAATELPWPARPTFPPPGPSSDRWLKCCSRTSLPFSTRTSRMWMALIFRWAFP